VIFKVIQGQLACNLKANKDFLLLISSNLGPISHRFQDMATYILKLAIKNCGQTVAPGYMVRLLFAAYIGSRQRPIRW